MALERHRACRGTRAMDETSPRALASQGPVYEVVLGLLPSDLKPDTRNRATRTPMPCYRLSRFPAIMSLEMRDSRMYLGGRAQSATAPGSAGPKGLWLRRSTPQPQPLANTDMPTSPRIVRPIASWTAYRLLKLS